MQEGAPGVDRGVVALQAIEQGDHLDGEIIPPLDEPGMGQQTVEAALGIQAGALGQLVQFGQQARMVIPAKGTTPATSTYKVQYDELVGIVGSGFRTL